MNTKITVSMAAAAVVAISMAFVPASADSREDSAAVAQATVLVSAETPQDAVWDMTYGAEKPVQLAHETASAAQEEETVDLSMG